MTVVKAAQIQNTLSSLTPIVHDGAHQATPQYAHHSHLHGVGGHGGQIGGHIDHLHQSSAAVLDQAGHNFSVDSLMTAQQQQAQQQQQQHLQHQSEPLGSSREGSPNGPTPPLGPPPSASPASYRAAAAAAAMASWTSNCSAQHNYVDENHPSLQEENNYRSHWYSVPTAGGPGGSPLGPHDHGGVPTSGGQGGHPYHQATTPPLSTSSNTSTYNTPAAQAAAAAAAAAAAYRNSVFHYNQECNSATAVGPISEIPKY